MIKYKFLDSELNPTARKCDPITGALIQGGSGVLGSLVGGIFGASSQNSANKTNMQIAQMNNEFNERMMQKQMDYNTDMWNKQNEYNSPSAQVSRLKAAGLNPYLMMSGSNGNLGSASSANSANMASSSGNPNMQAYNPQSAIDTGVNAVGGAIANYVANKKAEGELAKMEFEKSMMDMQLKLLSEDYKTKAAENAERLEGMKFDNANRRAEYENKLWSNMYQQSTFNSDVNIKRYQEEIAHNETTLQGLQALQLRLQSKSMQQELDSFPKRLAAELENLYANTYAAYMSGQQSKAGADYTFTLKASELIKQYGYHIDNYKNQRTAKSFIKTAQFQAGYAKSQADISDKDATGWNYYLHRYTEPLLHGVGLGTGVFLGLKGAKRTKIKGFH